MKVAVRDLGSNSLWSWMALWNESRSLRISMKSSIAEYGECFSTGFPYAAYFLYEAGIVVPFAVLDQHQDPARWQERVP